MGVELVYVHDKRNVNNMNGTAFVPQKREMISIIRIITESFVMVISIALDGALRYIRYLIF